MTSGTDFLDSTSANKVLTALGTASTSLRTEASALGSNLSIVQIRQDFSKSLINVLQTGCVQPDAGRHERGSGKQPGAVDPPVDRGLRVVAGQPVAAERAATAPLISAKRRSRRRGYSPPFLLANY